MKDISAFLMFSGKQLGKAKEALDLYLGSFPRSCIERLDLYGPHDAMGSEGTVRTAIFYLNGQKFMAMDSAMPHAFNFTPSLSLFVECETDEEIVRLYEKLSADGGEILMPLDNYGFSQRFGWVNDKFGVSWQLNHGALVQKS